MIGKILFGTVVAVTTARAATLAHRIQKASWVPTLIEVEDGGQLHHGELDIPVPFDDEGHPVADEALWAPLWYTVGLAASLRFKDQNGDVVTAHGPLTDERLSRGTVFTTSHKW